MSDTAFLAPIGQSIWDLKYRLKDRLGEPIDLTVNETWWRIARALAEPEGFESEVWAGRFYQILSDFKFLPAGRIVAGAGAGRNVTLSNCYVMGTIPDSMDGIFTHLKEAALTMQAGGGIGYDFSPIRPKGSEVKGVSADASGPLTFLDVWDAMCRTVMSAGSRRGAMMATMDCSHPDIEAFIDAKRDPNRLRMFNLSVLISDDFMKAVENDGDWHLCHKSPPFKPASTPDGRTEVAGRGHVYRTIKARDLWDKITRSTYDYAEPGVIFIDRINRLHNLWYIDDIRATNPCGEKAMGPYDSCLLGSINLAMFVKDPYTKNAQLDGEGIAETVTTAIRMMDNVIEVNYFPLPQQEAKARQTRQLGLGVTGLADMLLMLGIKYGSNTAVLHASDVMEKITRAAYATSIQLAVEKGKFPDFRAEQYAPVLGGESFISVVLPDKMQKLIREKGIRNSLLISIAPTGTISLYAGNVSSGIEPIFAPSYMRKVLQPDGSKTEELVEDFAIKVWHDLGHEGLPPNYIDAQSLTPEDHIRMQAAVQYWVDSSISKTTNVPENISFEDFQDVYKLAYDMGCKGCTTYRPNDITGSILTVPEKPAPEAEPEGGSMIFDDPEGPENEALWLFPDTDVPQARPEALPAVAYKLKAGSMEHAVYVTITDMVDWEGNHRPFEVFINTKDPAHQAWMTALTRMISAIFRRPYDSSFVVEELKAVFDPTFHAFIGGKPVPSLVAAIGGVIERHMKDIGYIKSEVAHVTGVEEASKGETRSIRSNPAMVAPYGPTCQKCFSHNVKNESGCLTCLDCGSSKCG